MDKVTLKGGPFNGETKSIHPDCNELKIVQVSSDINVANTDIPPQFRDPVKEYSYRRSVNNKLIFIYDFK